MRAIVPLVFIFLCACAGKHPAYVAVPQAQFRSEDHIKLPLSGADVDKLIAYFDHGGNRFGRDTVPDPDNKARQQVLFALKDPANLAARTNAPARVFCDMAPALCGQAALFARKDVVQEIVDARDERPPFPRPLAVSDGHYWWIFRHSHGQFTELLVVRTIERQISR